MAVTPEGAIRPTRAGKGYIVAAEMEVAPRYLAVGAIDVEAALTVTGDASAVMEVDSIAGNGAAAIEVDAVRSHATIHLKAAIDVESALAVTGDASAVMEVDSGAGNGTAAIEVDAVRHHAPIHLKAAIDQDTICGHSQHERAIVHKKHDIGIGLIVAHAGIPSPAGQISGSASKNRIRGWQHLHAGRQGFWSTCSRLHRDLKPPGTAIKPAPAEIQIHREKAIGQSRAARERAPDLVAAGDGIIEFEEHRVSAIGVRAAVAELALISEGRYALGCHLLYASEQCQPNEQGVEFGFHHHIKCRIYASSRFNSTKNGYDRWHNETVGGPEA